MEVLSIARFSQRFCHARDLLTVDPTLSECDFLQTGDFHTLPVFNGCNELTGFKYRFMRAGIQPSITASQNFHVELACLEISTVHVGNLQFAAPGWLHAPSNAGGVVIKKIQ